MRLLEYFHDYPPQANPNPFRPKSTRTPPPHREIALEIALDTFLNAVEHDARNIKPEPVRDNLTSRERHALRSLNKHNIVIKSANKGSTAAVMDRDWYINEYLRQLNDNKFYRPLDNDITDDIQRVQVYVDGAVLFEKVPNRDLLGFGMIFGEFVSPVQVYTLASPLRVARGVLLIQPRPQLFSLKKMGGTGKGPGIGWSRVQPRYS